MRLGFEKVKELLDTRKSHLMRIRRAKDINEYRELWDNIEEEIRQINVALKWIEGK